MSSGPPGPGIWVQSKPGEGPVDFVRWEGGGSEPKAVLSAIEPVLEPEEVSFLFFSPFKSNFNAQGRCQMEVGPAFHRVMHHLNHASTACQGKNLADCLLGSMQLTRHTHTHVCTHTHTLSMLCYTTFLLKMSSPIQDRL